MIAEYSPNTRWGKQHVKLVLMLWAYKAEFIIDVGGNCTGMDVIEAAVEMPMKRRLKQESFSLVLMVENC